MNIPLGLIGFLGLVLSIICLRFNHIHRRSLRFSATALFVTLLMFISGMVMESSTSNIAADKTLVPYDIQMLEEAVEEEIEKSVVEEEIEESNVETFIPNIEPEVDHEKEAEVTSSVVSGVLEVHFIDVGQGDSILIKTPQKNILIDGGNRGTTALNYIRNQGVNALDFIISTHPHADHIGGLINVIQSIQVGEVIDPAVPHTTKTFEEYITLIDQKGIWFTEGRAGMKWDVGGGATIHILHPTSPSQSDLNNASIVVRLTFGEVSFLFAGDAESAAESQILNRGYELNSTILKVGHHGSKTSTTQAFLKAVKPEAAIIMCGKTNAYGHPHQDILNKLSAANVEIYRTDLHGSIVVVTDGDTYSINKEPYDYAENQQPPPSSGSENPQVAPMVIEGEFVGSKNSDKYHYPNCSYAKNIAEGNRVWFDSIEAASAAGYVACRGCNPPSVIVTQPPAAEPTPAPSTNQAVFVGSKNSDKYHYPSCGHAKKILPGNLITFNSVADAISKGYVPCGSCKPPGN